MLRVGFMVLGPTGVGKSMFEILLGPYLKGASTQGSCFPAKYTTMPILQIPSPESFLPGPLG